MRSIPLGAMLFAASVSFCQTPVKDPDTLQALLVEVRQLRQNIEAMTAASQRVQIALYGLQMQDAAVARATQRLDSARNKCTGADGNRQHTATEIQRMESGLAIAAMPENEARAFKVRLTEMKNTLEVQTAEVQACQAAEAEASSQLRSDQTKLLDLQDRIARLDKALEQLGDTAQ
jgi:septation ring formation regulator EzrA